MSCLICCSAVSPSLILKCMRCDYECCKECISKWIRESRATCPNPTCNLELTREVLTDTFPKLVPVLVEKQKSDLFEAARAQMPTLTREVEAYRKYKDLKDEQAALMQRRRELEDELAGVKQTLYEIQVGTGALKTDDFRTLIRVMRDGTNRRARDLDEAPVVAKRLKEEGKDAAKAPAVVCPCVKGGCKGFTVQSPECPRYAKCVVCDTFVCMACMCETPSPVSGAHQLHVCNADDLASAEVVRKESKPCPKCGTRISKVSGCDQMFCVACQTAFSWTSGTIETGVIHNPEYFRLRRRMQEQGLLAPVLYINNIDDDEVAVPCGGVFVHRFHRQGVMQGVVDLFERHFAAIQAPVSTNESALFAVEALRFFIHLARTPTGRVEPVVKDNRLYIIQFMVGELDEKEFQSRVMKREKEVFHKRDVKAVNDVFFDGGNQLLEGLFKPVLRATGDLMITMETVQDFREKMEALIAMCNSRFEKISKIYGTKLHRYKVTIGTEAGAGGAKTVYMSYE